MKQHPRPHPHGVPKKQIPIQANHCIIEVFFLTIVLIPDPQFGQVVLTEESPLTLGGTLIGVAIHTGSIYKDQLFNVLRSVILVSCNHSFWFLTEAQAWKYQRAHLLI